MSVEIITGFDGASPYADAGVKRESEDCAVVLPSLRRMPGRSEEAPGAGSRFNIRLHNPSAAPQRFTVIADWETPARVSGHDLGYVRHGEVQGSAAAPSGAMPDKSTVGGGWRMIPGFRMAETRIEYRLELPPGMTELGLFPEFNYGACANFAADCRSRGVGVEVIGRSRENRDMWMLSLPSPSQSALPFFLQARDHAYETAGSYCVLGIVDFLLGDAALAQYLRSKFHVYIVPMTNPDGVYNGMSRLTWEQGADMNRINTVPDAAHDALQSAIDRVRPAVHMNIHNWTNKFVDGLLANDQTIADKILTHMPADSAHFKRWKVETTADYIRSAGWEKLPAEEVRERRKKSWSWKNYCKETFDAIGVNFEFPWFGLDPAAMRAKGVRAFCALALAAVEEWK